MQCASVAFDERVVSTTVDQAKAVAAADIDGDNDIDVLGAGNSSLYWFENDASQSFTARKLAAPVGYYHYDVVVVDVDPVCSKYPRRASRSRTAG